MAHATRDLGDGYSVRVAYAGSDLDIKSVRAHVSQLGMQLPPEIIICVQEGIAAARETIKTGSSD
jgi:hypothetical protein